MRSMRPATMIFVLALAAFLLLAFVVTNADAARKKYKSDSDDAYLGIYMQEVDDDLAEAFNLEIDFGAFVTDVVDDSPADNAGIRDRDVIVEFDGEKVNDTEELTDMIQGHQPGDSVTVKVMRRNKERVFAVELGEDGQSSLSALNLDRNLWNNYNNNWLSFSSNRGGYLGVSTIGLSDQLADYFGVRYGVLVEEVEEDSPAERAGLRAGDVIMKINDEQIDSPSDLAEIIGDHEDGDEVNVTVFRERAEQSFTATLEEGNNWGTFQGLDPLILNVPTPPTPSGYHFESREDYREEMEKLQDEMEKLQDEIEVIREKLK